MLWRMTPQVIVPIVIAVVALVVLIRYAISRQRANVVEADHTRLFELQNEWHAPAELLGAPVPRPVILTWPAKLALMAGLAFLVGMAVLGNVLYHSFRQSQERYEQLKQNGVSTQATVMRTWSSGSGKNRRYYVLYQFTADGSIIQRTASVSSPVYNRVRQGQQVAVLYLASDPRLSRMEIESGPTPVWVAMFPSLMLLFVALAMGFPILSQRKLLQYGQPAPAIVTRSSPVKGGRLVSYRFLDSVNNIIDGRATVSSSKAPEPGAVVAILYDPNNSKRSALYPPQMVRLEGNWGIERLGD